MIGNFSLYFFHFFRSLHIYFMCSSIIIYSLRYYITILEKVYFIFLKLYYYSAHISRDTVVSRDNIIHTYCRHSFLHETFFILQFFSHVPLSILRQTQLINKLYSFLTFHLTYIYIYIYKHIYKNFNAGEDYSLSLDYPKSLCRYFEMQRHFSI